MLAGSAHRVARFLLTGSPLGRLVHRVARIPASVHAKLLGAFLIITLLFIAMGAVSLEIIARVGRQSHLLDKAHLRVDASRQIEHALAMQMNFTAMALLLKDEPTIAKILRENNRFNDTLLRIEEAAPPEEREIIDRIRAAQEQVLTTVADIANFIRDDKLAEAMALQRGKGVQLYAQIDELVQQVVTIEEGTMDTLRQSVDAGRRRTFVLLGTFVGASIALALVMGFVTSWSFILPVQEAERFLGEVEKGDFGTTITVPNRDEFGALAAHMNRMSGELRHLYEQLERASMAKSDFVASMSHELRTPLNAILGFTELIVDGVYGDIPEGLKNTVSDINTCGKQLLALINDVLDLSKIEANRMELNLGDYAVEEIVSRVRLSLGALAQEKGLEFQATTEDDIPTAHGDAQRLTQCLMNLTGNALKFTRQGHVEIRVERQGEMLLYRVSDTGIGIPPDQIQNLFTEFRQVDPTIARDFGGTGLGLSITRKFVELHGGRIWVESQLGTGSTFLFIIPLRLSRPETA
jgi:signal transduction histidine kinase